MRNTNQASAWRRWLAMAMPVLVPAVVFAEPLVLTAPPPEAPAPTANPLADANVAHGKILIIPFAAVNPNDTSPWLGKSIQDSLVADLTVAAPGRVITSEQPASTLDAAIALGKQAGAHFVIAGGFITVNQELRITGQVVDVDSGKAVAGLKATGDPSHIFQMEDGLALQIRTQALGEHLIPVPPAIQQPIADPQYVQPQPSPTLQYTQPQPAPVQAQPAPESAGVAYAGQSAEPQYYSSYAVPPTPTIYGSDYAGYTSSPAYYDLGYTSAYSPYYYPPTYCYPYCSYGYGLGWCFPFGFGFGYNYGNGYYHNYRGYDRTYGGRNYAYRGVASGRNGVSLGIGNGGISASASFRSSGLSGRVSISPDFSRTATARSSGVPYRSASIFSRGSSGFSGGFHSSGSFHGGGSFGGGGGHASGGGGHAGGHR